MTENKRIKILVVDDEPDNVELLMAYLSNDYDIIPSYSGNEALGILKADEANLPDLVLMDIMLKDGMDGVEAARHILVNYDIPVVYITAYADENIMRRAKLTEPFGYILKPFEETELRTNIEIALYKHQMEQKLKASQKWLTAVLNSIADAVIATDEEGNIKLMNPFAEALTGWNHEEAMGKPLTSVFAVESDESGEEAENPVKKVLREGMFYGLGNKTMLITKNKTRVPVDIIGSPIRSEAGSLLGILILFYDISDRKRIEKMIFSGEGPDY
ncbi:PAS domain S-box-containing protein [Methanohalophilus levihalophilus]|uniref:ATP-binding response regulator n=1 Tax=Methanohalophilus levihalophilus TaxID=1431282 RepID=UPI001AE9898E|nr:response regulator [Methanohalophilus levihalophilus]MBP2029560.1 PAS domain S-box-containing protein [Methanohalophilus levihalophilus]